MPVGWLASYRALDSGWVYSEIKQSGGTLREKGKSVGEWKNSFLFIFILIPVVFEFLHEMWRYFMKERLNVFKLYGYTNNVMEAYGWMGLKWNEKMFFFFTNKKTLAEHIIYAHHEMCVIFHRHFSFVNQCFFTKDSFDEIKKKNRKGWGYRLRVKTLIILLSIHKKKENCNRKSCNKLYDNCNKVRIWNKFSTNLK